MSNPMSNGTPPTVADLNTTVSNVMKSGNDLVSGSQKIIQQVKSFAGHKYAIYKEYKPIIYIITILAFAIILFKEESWWALGYTAAGATARYIGESDYVKKTIQDYKWVWDDSEANQALLILALMLLMPDRYTMGALLLGAHIVNVITREPKPGSKPISSWLSIPNPLNLLKKKTE